MSIKHRIKMKNPVAKELRTPKFGSKVIKDKTIYDRKKYKEEERPGDLPNDTVRFEEHDEKDYKQKCKIFFEEQPVFVNEDEDYAKHLAKFFKGKSEVE